MELREALLLVRRESLVARRDGRAVFDWRGEGRDDGGDDVVNGGADAEAVQGDDVAGDEGRVGVVHEVLGVAGEVLVSRISICVVC